MDARWALKSSWGKSAIVVFTIMVMIMIVRLARKFCYEENKCDDIIKNFDNGHKDSDD